MPAEHPRRQPLARWVQCVFYNEESADTHTLTIYTEAKINRKMAPTGLIISLPGSLALRRAAFWKCCATRCQTPREIDSKGSLGSFSDLSWPRCVWSWCVSAASLVLANTHVLSGAKFLHPLPVLDTDRGRVQGDPGVPKYCFFIHEPTAPTPGRAQDREWVQELRP